MTTPTDAAEPTDPADAPLDYGSYVRVDDLLALQQPRSRPEHPDELLFIVVHQASELWFKVILHELDALVDAFERRETMFAVLAVRRLNALVRIVSAHLSALETLPPQRFAQFRGYLGGSSGSQSAQFRAIEAASGLREPHYLRALEEHGPVAPAVRAALARPTLQEQFEALLAAEGRTLEELYTGPAPTPLFLHVQLVERIIGPISGGTGGTLGARYLERTVHQRFFPRLWEVRARFHGARPAAPR